MRLYLGRKFYLELALPQRLTRNSELRKKAKRIATKTPNKTPQKHQTKHRKNTKQNAAKTPNALQNPQETSIFAASLYSKQYGILLLLFTLQGNSKSSIARTISRMSNMWANGWTSHMESGRRTLSQMWPFKIDRNRRNNNGRLTTIKCKKHET